MTREEAKEHFWTDTDKFGESVAKRFGSINYSKIFTGYYIGSEIDRFIDKIYNEFEKELEELNNRSCKNCKYSFDIFTGIDNNLLGEDFICTKLEVDKVFEKNFCCNRYEKKDSECN